MLCSGYLREGRCLLLGRNKEREMEDEGSTHGSEGSRESPGLRGKALAMTGMLVAVNHEDDSSPKENVS